MIDSHVTHGESRRSFGPRRRWLLLLPIPLGGGAVVMLTDRWSISGKPLLDMALIVGCINVCLYVWVRTGVTFAPKRQLAILALLFGIEVGTIGLVRLDGLMGNGRPIFAWRWQSRPVNRFFKVIDLGLDGDNNAILVKRWVREDEEFRTPKLRGRNLSPQQSDESVDLSATTPYDFPAFRGADRFGKVHGVRLAAHWDSTPPRELWRQPIGVGWSSFAVVGDFAVTQEQRGDDECIVCYEKRTGHECWAHRDAACFVDFTGGDGPRATPTIADGAVFALGATGILNCLDGSTGKPVWSVNILQQNAIENCLFGMVGSPLVVGDVVIVSPGGKGCSLAAYDRRTGKVVWKGGDADGSYSSPHLATIDGTEQVLIFNGDGLYGHSLAAGAVLWNVPWVSNPEEKNNVCQPVFLPGVSPGQSDRVFISSGYGMGCALFEVTRVGNRFGTRKLWATKSLKAKFTSVVERSGFVYGLDNGILVCVDLNNGLRCWKGGRYGHGQVILVDDLLLVQAERGDVVLVEATPSAFREQARFAALDDRTWNQPVLSGSVLLVRNDREAAAYELPLEADE